MLDVARFCVEDEPGWEVGRRAKFIGGHPRIGAPLNAPTSELSEESRKEQMKGGQVDPATLESKYMRTLASSLGLVLTLISFCLVTPIMTANEQSWQD